MTKTQIRFSMFSIENPEFFEEYTKKKNLGLSPGEIIKPLLLEWAYLRYERQKLVRDNEMLLSIISELTKQTPKPIQSKKQDSYQPDIKALFEEHLG